MKQKRSIKSRMIITLSSAIAFVFLILFLAFNILFSGFIRRDAVKELKDSMTRVSSALKSGLGNINSASGDSELAGIVQSIRKLVRTKLLISEQDIIILGKNYNVLFPKNQNNGSISLNQAGKIAEAFSRNNFKKQKPEKITVNERTYYAAIIPVAAGNGAPQAYIVFFSDVSGMDAFRSAINKVLLFSFLVAGIFAVAFVIFFSGRTVKSINKLCSFSRSVGEGKLEKQDMDFKERELQELSDDMNAMAVKLAEQQELQSIFFQNVSHEFKTPLMSIQGYAESIKYGIVPDREKACDIITHECSRLSDLVNDLMFISRFESRNDSLKLERTELGAMLADCCESLYGFAAGKGKKIAFKPSQTALYSSLDGDKMARAVSNLISNGIRHARETVSVTCERRGIKNLIMVTDDGEGFDPVDMPHLFKRFYKGKNGNSGLGLSIAKSIVEAHNGSISASNTPSGAKFEIVLENLG